MCNLELRCGSADEEPRISTECFQNRLFEMINNDAHDVVQISVLKAVLNWRSYTHNGTITNHSPIVGDCQVRNSSNRKSSQRRWNSDWLRGPFGYEGASYKQVVAHGWLVVWRLSPTVVPIAQSDFWSVNFNIVQKIVLDLQYKGDTGWILGANAARLMDTSTVIGEFSKHVLLSCLFNAPLQLVWGTKRTVK